ncbi:hypothetical protein JZ751_021283, partial [Albula glossodonta]
PWPTKTEKSTAKDATLRTSVPKGSGSARARGRWHTLSRGEDGDCGGRLGAYSHVYNSLYDIISTR